MKNPSNASDCTKASDNVSLNIPPFENLRRYRVTQGTNCIYSLVTSKMDEQMIIKELEKRFRFVKQPYRIYCNGKLLKKCNYKSGKHFEQILDKETGILYPNLYEFCDNFLVDVNEAKIMIKRLHRFKWITNE